MSILTFKSPDYEILARFPSLRDRLPAIRAKFEALDLNGNEVLEASEIQRMYELAGQPRDEEYVQQLLAMVDSTDSGKLTFGELMHILAGGEAQPPVQEFVRLFEDFNISGNRTQRFGEEGLRKEDRTQATRQEVKPVI